MHFARELLFAAAPAVLATPLPAPGVARSEEFILTIKPQTRVNGNIPVNLRDPAGEDTVAADEVVVVREDAIRNRRITIQPRRIAPPSPGVLFGPPGTNFEYGYHHLGLLTNSTTGKYTYYAEALLPEFTNQPFTILPLTLHEGEEHADHHGSKDGDFIFEGSDHRHLGGRAGYPPLNFFFSCTEDFVSPTGVRGTGKYLSWGHKVYDKPKNCEEVQIVLEKHRDT